MVSAYSVATGILWFTVCIGALLILRWKSPLLLKYGAALSLCAIILAIVRMLLPLDLAPAYVIQSFYLYPALERILRQTFFGGWAVWQWLLLIWGVGSVITLVVGCVDCARFIHVVKRLPRMRDPVSAKVAQRLGLDPSQLLVVGGIPVPMMVGLVHPMIVLPPMQLSEAAMTWVLRHEMTHIRLHDNWWKLMGLVLQAALWWNPVSYFFTKSLDSVLEFRCDEALLRNCSSQEREAYANALRDVAAVQCDKKLNCPSVALAFARPAVKNELLLRIRLIMKRTPGRACQILLSIAACVALFIASYFVIIQPAGFPPEEELSGVIEITPDNAYLVHSEDGTYELWVDGVCISMQTDDDLKLEPLCDLEIQEE